MRAEFKDRIGLNHVFIVEDAEDFPLGGPEELLAKDYVSLHDDFLGYIWNSIVWIPTFNPMKNEPNEGLCRYGITSLGSDSAEKAAKILRAWTGIFREGPETLILTGSWVYIEGEPMETGGYEELRFDRSELTDKLEKLAAFCDMVKAGEGAKHLVHYGV